MKQIRLTHNDLPWAVESLLERMERLENMLSEKEDKDSENRQPEFLTVAEAAKFLSLTTSGVYHKVFKKEIPFIKVSNSNRVRFSRKALTAWLMEGQKQAA